MFICADEYLHIWQKKSTKLHIASAFNTYIGICNAFAFSDSM